MNITFYKKTIVVIIMLFIISTGVMAKIKTNEFSDSNIRNNDSNLFEGENTILYKTSFEKQWIEDLDGDYLAPPGWDIDGISKGTHTSASYKTYYFSQMTENEDIHLIQDGTSSIIIWWSTIFDGLLSTTNQNEWLISPSINVSQYYDISLIFWSVYLPTQILKNNLETHELQVDNTYSIKISADNKETWREIADLREPKYELGVDLSSQFNPDNEYGEGWFFHESEWPQWSNPRGDFFNMYDEPVEITIRLNPEERRIGDSIQIAWHYQYKPSGPQAIWAIDNITITGEKDEQNPTLTIEKPKQNTLYIRDKQISETTEKTIIIGDITVEVNAYDIETGMKSVEFTLDDTIQKTDNSKPFSWRWDKFSLGEHTLHIKATDFAGNSKSEEFTIIKIL